MIIGVAGSFASGKDTVADYLVDRYGFYHVSTSDLVREEAMKRHGSIERPILYQTANEIRQSIGFGALSELAIKKYQAVKADYPKGLVVTGFRAQAEADVIKHHDGVIIYIDAPFEERYKRMQARSRDNETGITKEAFFEREQKENGGENPAFNIAKIKETADVVYENVLTLEELYEVADKLMVKYT